MRHAYMYSGAYETNYGALTPGSKTYKTTEGKDAPVDWPDEIDGIRVSYMEKAGKKFYAVRVQHDAHDVILENPVHIDAERHMNNRRFTANPMSVTDDEASALLDDIIRDNPDKRSDLALMINRINSIRRESRAKAE